MAIFKDAKGREWTLELDLQTANDIQREHGVDLLDTEKLGETFVKLGMGSLAKFVGVITMLVFEQMKSREVTPEDFARALKAEHLRAASEALQEAIADFSHSPEVAETKRKLFRAAHKAVHKKLTAMNEEELVAKMSDESALGSPASSEPTLGGGVSAS